MTAPPLSDIVSCLAGYDPDALPVEQARKIIRECVAPVNAVENVDLHHAFGRVLATDIVSPINVPAHDNSAMDGYAIRGADLLSDASVTLKIVGTALAGQAFSGTVQSGECVHIMTGAVMPVGCDTVMPQEFVQTLDGKQVRFPSGAVRIGDNCRLKGEDLKTGATALEKGRILGPAQLGLLASLGMADVPVQRRLRVAIFSTGDELRSFGEVLREGDVYDSNRYTLHAMLTRMGCDILDMGIVRDDQASLESAFNRACASADVLITSGGVSVGEADYTKQVMAALGDVAFWKIGMRPGRPMAFGKIRSGEREAMLFGLPGNPVAVMVTFYFIVRDALFEMMGATPPPLPVARVKTQHPIAKKSGRTEYQRGVLARAVDGELTVQLTGTQGSGILRSMSDANCMIILEPEQSDVLAGEWVDVVFFDGLM